MLKNKPEVVALSPLFSGLFVISSLGYVTLMGIRLFNYEAI